MNLGERYMGTHFITPETLLQDFFFSQNKTLEGIKLYAINLSEKASIPHVSFYYSPSPQTA